MRSLLGWSISVAVLLGVLLATGRPAAASPGQEFTVSGSGVPLRAEPSETAEVLRDLTPDHLLVEFSRRGDWVKVGVYREIGAFGWVPVADLVPAERPTQAALPPEPEPQPRALPEAPPLLMEITGTPAVKIKGNCTVVGQDGRGRGVDLASQIPKSYSFKAVAVDCRIRKNDFFGRMRIALSQAGRILAEKQINGPFNQIWIRSDGPWGQARAILRGGLVVRERPRPTPLPN